MGRSKIEVFDCEQQSEDWYRARMGIPTASEFKTVLAKGKDGGVSATRRTYMLKLAGEIITQEPMEHYTNSYMERGRRMEEEAREVYSIIADEEPVRVGFIKNVDRGCGCSPDSLIGKNGGVEIKTAAAHFLIEYRLKDEVPSEHIAQCQGFLLVTEREWVDLAIYWPKLPLFKKRIYRNDAYLRRLDAEIRRFNEELAAIVAKVK